MALESTITNSIIKYINSLEGGIAEKTMGNAFQFGRADINACYKGHCLKIEVKTADHGNKASLAQELYLKEWGRAGAVCMVVYSLAEVKKAIKKLEEEQ